VRAALLSAAVLLLATAACGGEGVSVEPITGPVAIDAPVVDLDEGEMLQLGVLVGGRRVSPTAVEWESRDVSTVRVQNGVARGVAPGLAWVVVRSGAHADSVRLVVHFAGLGAGAGARVGGSDGVLVRWGGGAFVRQFLRYEQPDATHILAANGPAARSLAEAMERDSVLHLYLVEERVAPGTYPLGPCDVKPKGGVTCGERGLTLEIRDGGGRKLWVPVREAPLVVTEVRMPPAPGLATGSVRGWTSFEGAGFSIRDDEGGGTRLEPLGDTTVHVYAEFSLPLYHVLVGYTSLLVQGRGFTWAGEDLDPAAFSAEGGLRLAASARLHAHLPRYALARWNAWVPSPGRGTYAVAPSGGARAWSRLEVDEWVDEAGEVRGPVDRGPAGRGTVTITQYDAPTATGYGMVRGVMEAAVPDPFGPDSMMMKAVFVNPVDPLEGSPSAGPRF
jgi:hypothetical protein